MVTCRETSGRTQIFLSFGEVNIIVPLVVMPKGVQLVADKVKDDMQFKEELEIGIKMVLSQPAKVGMRRIIAKLNNIFIAIYLESIEEHISDVKHTVGRDYVLEMQVYPFIKLVKFLGGCRQPT